jgi:hypothetical protein
MGLSPLLKLVKFSKMSNTKIKNGYAFFNFGITHFGFQFTKVLSHFRELAV